MRISVALCTFNGSRFLGEQLASIAAQKRLPDELVVCDDCSSDETPQIVQRFAENAPFPVRPFINPANVGSTANFAAAIERSTGEVIALCDQDDVWLPNKLESAERVFVDSPETGLVFSNARTVDENLRPIGVNLWDAVRVSRRDLHRIRTGRGFDVLVRRNIITGATMAFRSVYKDLVLPVPPEWVHDGWIALLISAVSRIDCIEEPLIEYRQHPQQQLGERKRSLYQQYLRAKTLEQPWYRSMADQYQAAYDRLKYSPLPLASTDVLPTLARKVSHFEARARMRDEGVRRIPIILRELVRGHYGRFSLGWKSVAQDVFL